MLLPKDRIPTGTVRHPLPAHLPAGFGYSTVKLLEHRQALKVGAVQACAARRPEGGLHAWSML